MAKQSFDITANKFTIWEITEFFGFKDFEVDDYWLANFRYECWQTLKKEQPDLSEEEIETKIEEACDSEVEDEYNKWEAKAIENINFLCDWHKLDFEEYKKVKGVQYYRFMPAKDKSWKDVAVEIGVTIEGVGMFDVGNTKQWLREADCKSYKELVLTHLHWIKSMPEVYGEPWPNRELLKRK